jgi:outer membrane protein OmpA-like peptidoglycan-associated protein
MKIAISIIALTAVLAAGCATTQQATPQLSQAEQAYQQASSDPMITRYAPVTLREAAQALEMAENAENEEEAAHYAFIAERKVELARSLAAENAAEDQFSKLSAQRQDILLQLRSREAELARQEAREAQQEVRAYRSDQQQQELLRTQRETEQARAELDQLKREIETLEAQQTERGLLLRFGNVLFETDGADLKPGATLSISKLADFLKEHPDRQILIEGHTDSQGSADYNQQLSQERAGAVANALQAHGIGSERITTRGLGESYPIAPNETSAGRQQNRRVEIIIEDQGQAGAGKRTAGGS